MATFLHPPSPRPSPPLCQYRLENPILSAKSWQHVCLTHAGVAIIDHCSLASFPSLIPMRHRRRSEAEMGAFRYASVDSLLLPLPNANGAISKLISGDFPSPKQYPPPSSLPSLPRSLPPSLAAALSVRSSVSRATFALRRRWRWRWGLHSPPPSRCRCCRCCRPNGCPSADFEHADATAICRLSLADTVLSRSPSLSPPSASAVRPSGSHRHCRSRSPSGLYPVAQYPKCNFKGAKGRNERTAAERTSELYC